jgi:uncharacterized protein YceH (UPF0502 family)
MAGVQGRDISIMNESGNAAGAERSWAPLPPRQRRVLGVLVEKAKTTPEYYPLTVAAIVTGSNQKSNRDPLSNYGLDEVEETLQALRKKGAVVLIEGVGRVTRWKHTLYDWLKVTKGELAVLAELLLRGPQTEGDLRARASRMEPLVDLAALQAILDPLARRGLVINLSPAGQRRGVYVAHGLYPPDELEKVRLAFASRHAVDDDAPTRPAASPIDVAAPQSAPGWAAEVADLRNQIQDLRGQLASMAAEMRDLKSALGA